MKSRLKLIYQPAPPISPNGLALPIHDAPLPVMWSGRLCRQRNVDLLIEIARRTPAIYFEVFGAEGESFYGDQLAAAVQSLANLTAHGGYESFADLPKERFSAFLYTTLWDGIPNVLLAAAAAGLPIVAPAVGGIPELVDESTGWLVHDMLNPQAYVDALDEIRRMPEEAQQRTEAMRSRLLQQHSWDAYLQAMTAPPSFIS